MKIKAFLYGAVAMAGLAMAGCSKENLPDNIIDSIPEISFRLWCREQMGEWDRNGNGILSPSEAKAVKVIDMDGYEGMKVTSLAGIQFFPNIEELYCHDQALVALDVSKNKKLAYLNCRDNDITSLDVSKNGRLLRLSCYGNALRSLDVSKCPGLEVLYCDDNALTSLDVSKNTALDILGCWDNALTSIDISACRVLTVFDCGSNPGDGTTFPVTAWFDNGSVPSNLFTTEAWVLDGKTIAIDYRGKPTAE